MKRVALIIITGYLGAGKTTLIRRLLPALDQLGKRGLLIVNEVGDVNVDGAALGDAALEQRELLGGCACCSMRGDLYNALLEGIESYHPDYIMLETSGLAEPSELLDAATAPKLRGLLEVTDIVTVVDAANLARQLRSGQLAQMQARFASTIVLNKTDIASPKEIAAAREALAEHAPQAAIIEADADAALVLARSIAFLEDGSTSAWAMPAKDRHHHHHAHAGFFALNVDLPDEIPEALLKEALCEISAKAYRIKGFARVLGQDRPWIFQRVGDLPPMATAFALEGVNLPIGMVLIGAGVSEADVAETLARIGGKVRTLTS